MDNGNNVSDVSGINEKLMKEILDSFSEATGLRAVFTDLDGKPVVFPHTTESPKFCQLITSCADHKCHKSYAIAGRESVKWDEPYVFRCHAGLIGLAAPVMMYGLHIANIICGQVLMWDPDDFFWEEIQEMTSGIEVDFLEIQKAAADLRIISARQARSAANLLYITANVITENSFTIYKQRNLIKEQQLELNRRMLKKKNSPSSLSVYSIKLERDLLNSIREGKTEKAYGTLDKIMMSLLPEYSVRPNYVKVRVLEIMVLISRAFADIGCDVEKLLDSNLQQVQEMTKINLADKLFHWLKTILGSYFIQLEGTRDHRTTKVMIRVRDYMEKEYKKNITLDGLSQKFYFSPSYLSYVFKKELGMNIIDFLTNYRVEMAKKILLETNSSIAKVAEEVGFNSESYFSQVFKKLVGMPPGEFRKVNIFYIKSEEGEDG